MSNLPENYAPVVIVGGGPVGLGLAVDLAQRGVRAILVERYDEPAADPQGSEPDPAHDGAFLFLGRREANCARRARSRPEYGIGGMTAYGTLLGGYRYDWLQRELVRPYYFTDNERLPQYATEAVLRARAAQLPAIDDGCMAGRASASRRMPTASSVEIVDRDGAKRQRCAPTMSSAVTAADRSFAQQAGITQTLSDHDRLMVLLVFRSTELARAAGALSRQVVLLRAASRPEGLLEVLRPRRSRHHLVLPCAGAARHDSATISIFAVSCTRRSARSSTSSSSISASGTCASRSPTAIAPGRVLHRRRRGAQPSALWRLRRQYRPRGRGQSRLEARGGAARLGRPGPARLATTPNGGRCSLRRRAISSRRRSSATGNSSRAHDPARDRAAFEADWRERAVRRAR